MFTAEEKESMGLDLAHDVSLENLIKRPEMSFEKIVSVQKIAENNPELKIENILQEFGIELGQQIIGQVEVSFKYAGYISKQKDEIAKMNDSNHVKIPENFDYMSIGALSTEVRQKLTKYRPQNIGEASRISGVPPSAIGILLVYIKKHNMALS